MDRWLLIWLGILVSSIGSILAAEKPAGRHREKRILWITNDGRLALPPGTLLTITPTISMPFVRYPPDGFLSNMTISLPFTINFDMLGLTDNQNPYGALPPIIARGLGRSAGALVADYVASLFNNRRSSRASSDSTPPNTNGLFHGGERALLYVVVEDFLSNFGLDGKACLLRAICEVHGYSLKNLGFLGEILKLFFTASKSPFAEILTDYVQAERQGMEHGECFPYFKKCPKSLFLAPNNNAYVMDESEHDSEEIIEEIEEDKDSYSKVSISKEMLENNVM